MNSVKLLPLAGIALFAALLLLFDVQAVGAVLRQARPELLVLFLLAHVPIVFLKAVKWRYVLRVLSYRVTLTGAVRSWLGGFAISLLTPGRVGDFSRAAYVERERSRLGRPLLAVAADRLADVLLLLTFSVVGVVFFITVLNVQIGYFSAVVAVFVTAIAGVAAAMRKGTVAFFLKPLARRVLPAGAQNEAAAIFSGFYEGVEILKQKKRADGVVLGMTVAVWMLNIGQLGILSEALGLNVTMGYLFLAMPLIILADTLPVSFAGLGTREALLIFLLSFAGLNAEQAIGFSLVVLLLGYLPVGLAGLAVWMREPGRFVPKVKGA